jgi:hypothetical protein
LTTYAIYVPVTGLVTAIVEANEAPVIEDRLVGIVTAGPAIPAGAGSLVFVAGALQRQDLRTLEQARDIKWEQAKGWREAAVNADMSTPFGVIQCRPEDRSNISDAVTLANSLADMGLPVDITWTLADNTTVVLNRIQMIQVGLLLGQRAQTTYGQGRAVRAAIAAATTKTDVDAIEWPDG